MNKMAILFLLLMSTLILGGCSLYGGSPAVPSNQNNSSAPTQTVKTGSSSINIQNFAFNPSTLTVTKGSTVTWTNNDSATHKIKSDTFNSADLNTGQSFSFTFNTPGTFNYSCSIHPSMTGKIVVQ